MTRHTRFVGLSALLLAAALPACGIRGRPQPPLIILPAVVQDLSAVRLGGEVHLEFTVPEANADGSQPPDIERIDIYAVTTLPAADDGPLVLDEWIEDEDPVFTFDVVIPEEPEPGAEGDAGAGDAAGGGAGDRTDEAPAEAAAHAPGELVTAMELLTPDIVAPVEIDPEEEDEEDEELDEEAPEAATDGTPLAGPLVSPPLPRVPRRTYVAVAVSRRNRQSAAFAAPPVPVQPAPDPPGVPVVTYTETSIDIEWTAPDTARLPVQRAVAADGAGGDSLVEEVAAEVDEVAEDVAEPAPAADEPDAAEQTEPAAAADGTEPEAAAEAQEGEAGEAAADAGETPAPPVLESTMLLPLQAPTGYDVYDVSPPAETETETETGTEQGGGPAAGDGGILRPLNGEPLAATSQAGLPAALGVERCFYVRTVDTVDPVDSLPIRSAASETTCVLLADIFPPAAPAGLVAVAGAGAISLTWDANGEADLAGYVVLRGRGPEAELEALTPEPIAATNYRDTDVEAGIGYVYAVRALDGADPPNASEPSAQVEEQAP